MPIRLTRVPSPLYETLNLMGRLLGYTRTHQALQNDDPRVEALVAHGVAPCDIFSDGSAGSTNVFDYPELRLALEKAEAGDTLVVWRLDGLGRSLSEVLGAVSTLQARAVKLRSLQDGIDPDTADGQLMLNLLVRLAHYDRQLIGERIAAGMDSARQAGAKIGRPPIDPQVTADKLRTVEESRARGLTAAEAAQLVGWSRATFYRHLHEHESQP